ncbi:hypothetical protein LWC35_25560 [Pseudonocardia kujensis]|uniref:hypothetical protein n=1 Tax=Pseudonocardia kujensis TaxID=1128675 RepID=UPI001E5CAB68|nr:hypothetical protein [Pseudonocardia kujensis]MCE0766244.1 hypothetical protein [Pseudonocardia kujensis]
MTASPAPATPPAPDAPSAPDAPAGTSSSDTASASRIAAISGVVFAALFVVALVLVHRAPTLSDPDSAYAGFYANGGDQLFVAVGLYLVPFAGIAFLWHMTAIRAVLDTLTPTPSAMAHGLNLLAGAIFVTLLFAGTAAVGAVAFGVYFGHSPAEDPQTARALTGVGYGLVFVFAVRGAGMFALTTTTLLRNAKVLPLVPAVLAYLLAAFLLLAVTNNPAAVLVFPAWVVLISIFLLRHAHRVAAPAPEPGTGAAAPAPEPDTGPAAPAPAAALDTTSPSLRSDQP